MESVYGVKKSSELDSDTRIESNFTSHLGAIPSRYSDCGGGYACTALQVCKNAWSPTNVLNGHFTILSFRKERKILLWARVRDLDGQQTGKLKQPALLVGKRQKSGVTLFKNLSTR